MEKNKKIKVNVNLSFMDLLSCALGAMIFLALLFMDVKDPVTPPVIGEFIFVELQLSDANSLVGLEITPPNNLPVAIYPQDFEKDWSPSFSGVLENAVIWTGTSSKEQGNKRKVYARLTNPSQGMWRLKPYFFDSIIEGKGGLQDKNTTKLYKRYINTKIENLRCWSLSKNISVVKSGPQSIDSKAPGYYFDKSDPIKTAIITIGDG